MNSDHEHKSTFISPTFKFEENNMPLFFGSEFILVSYGDFVVSGRYHKTPHNLNMKNSSYLPQITSDLKNKVTLFSSTLKVDENNLPLIFISDVI